MGWLTLSTVTLGICHGALLGGILAWIIYVIYEHAAVANDINTKASTVNAWTASGTLFIIGLFFFFPILLLRFVSSRVAAIAVGQGDTGATGLTTLAVLFAFFLIGVGFFAWSMSWYAHATFNEAQLQDPEGNPGAFGLVCATGALFIGITGVMLWNYNVSLAGSIVQNTALPCTNLAGALKSIDPFWKD